MAIGDETEPRSPFRRGSSGTVITIEEAAQARAQILEQVEGFTGDGRLIEAAGVVWAVGLQWSGADIEPGKALVRARERVRLARTARVGNAEAGDEVDPDLVMVPSSSPVVEDEEGMTSLIGEQYALGSTTDGLRAGMPSLAAHLARLWTDRSVLALFKVGDDAVYLVAVQEGVVRPYTDRCFSTFEGLQVFNDLLRGISHADEQSLQWDVFVSPGIELSVVTVEARELYEFLSGDIGPVLRPLGMRVTVGLWRSLAAAVLCAVVLSTVWWYVRKDALERAELEETIRSVTQTVPDDVALAPWEKTPPVFPSRLIRSCASAIGALPYGVSATRLDPDRVSFAALVVRGVRCEDGWIVVHREPFLEVSSASQFGADERVPLGADWQAESTSFVPVNLTSEILSDEGLAPKEREEKEFRQVDGRLADIVDGFVRDKLSGTGLSVRVASLLEGRGSIKRDLGWARLGIEIAGELSPVRSSRLLRALDGFGPVQVRSVEWNVEEGWKVVGYVAGVTDWFVELRSRRDAVRGG